MQCPQCGATLPQDATICQSCHTVLTQETSELIVTEDPSFFLEEAARYEEVGLYADALSRYQRALVALPGSAELHGKIAECYRSQQNFQQALEFYKRAAELDGTDGVYRQKYDGLMQRMFNANTGVAAAAGPTAPPEPSLLQKITARPLAKVSEVLRPPIPTEAPPAEDEVPEELGGKPLLKRLREALLVPKVQKIIFGAAIAAVLIAVLAVWLQSAWNRPKAPQNAQPIIQTPAPPPSGATPVAPTTPPGMTPQPPGTPVTPTPTPTPAPTPGSRPGFTPLGGR